MSPKSNRAIKPSTARRRFNVEPLEGRVLFSATQPLLPVAHVAPAIVVASTGALSPQVINPVNWTGDGDGVSWSDPANWSGDAVPGSDSAVTIDVSGNPTIDFTSAAGNVTIQSLAVSNSFVISSGSLTIDGVGTSQAASSLSITGGALSVTGAGVAFMATGPTSVNGGSLYALAGATLSLPELQTIDGALGHGQFAAFQADGTGSLLNLSAATTVTATSASDSGLTFEASNGGEVNLSGLTSITGGQATFETEGSGSLLNLSSLTTLNGTGGDGYASLTANGGSISLNP